MRNEGVPPNQCEGFQEKLLIEIRVPASVSLAHGVVEILRLTLVHLHRGKKGCPWGNLRYVTWSLRGHVNTETGICFLLKNTEDGGWWHLPVVKGSRRAGCTPRVCSVKAVIWASECHRREQGQAILVGPCSKDIGRQRVALHTHQGMREANKNSHGVRDRVRQFAVQGFLGLMKPPAALWVDGPWWGTGQLVGISQERADPRLQRS